MIIEIAYARFENAGERSKYCVMARSQYQVTGIYLTLALALPGARFTPRRPSMSPVFYKFSSYRLGISRLLSIPNKQPLPPNGPPSNTSTLKDFQHLLAYI